MTQQGTVSHPSMLQSSFAEGRESAERALHAVHPDKAVLSFDSLIALDRSAD